MSRTAKDPERRLQEKRERFQRIAPKRMRALEIAIRRLGNCSNRATYAYTAEEVEIILEELRLQVQLLQERFGGAKGLFLTREEE